jgi:hypothetical protein
MTNGSRLEEVGLLRLVGGFHGVRAYSGVFQAPSYCSSGPPWQSGERCPSQFMEWLLSEVSKCSDEKDGLASPLYRPTVHSPLQRGQGLPVRHHLVLSRWWLAMFVEGKEASRGVVIS